MTIFLNKSGAVVGFYPEDFEGVGVFRIYFEVLPGEFLLYGVLVARVHEGDDCAFETGPGEPSAINAWERAHYVVDGNQFRTSAFVIVD